VYDVTSRESFDNIKDWLKEIDIYSTNEDAVKMLIGNKVDLVHTSIDPSVPPCTLRLSMCLYVLFAAVVWIA
jgi:hypothetical protein